MIEKKNKIKRKKKKVFGAKKESKADACFDCIKKRALQKGLI